MELRTERATTIWYCVSIVGWCFLQKINSVVQKTCRAHNDPFTNRGPGRTKLLHSASSCMASACFLIGHLPWHIYIRFPVCVGCRNSLAGPLRKARYTRPYVRSTPRSQPPFNSTQLTTCPCSCHHGSGSVVQLDGKPGRVMSASSVISCTAVGGTSCRIVQCAASSTSSRIVHWGTTLRDSETVARF